MEYLSDQEIQNKLDEIFGKKEIEWFLGRKLIYGGSTEKPTTGMGLIYKERIEQLYIHNRTIEWDMSFNKDNQLIIAASVLLNGTIPADIFHMLIPKNWNEEIWSRMLQKPYKERLIIAGALIAAELDRILYIEKQEL